jgi:perosamine synthetase
MIRRQLSVASPISPTALIRALIESARPGSEALGRARSLIAAKFGSSGVALTDSGTSALVLALRLVARPGDVVGFPGYACVDLASAARFAGVGACAYDIDPATLSPDLESVERLLCRGPRAVVVAHLFGYPADVPAVRRLAAAHGVPVIEDAAQAAGATLEGKRLGSLGDLSVLSFGRGKGLCAGGGGALLGFDERWAKAVDSIRLSRPGRGWSGLAKTGIQWALGRPSLYALPSVLPWLHLGEMIYHEAHQPRPLPIGSGDLLRSALELEPHDVTWRRTVAKTLTDAAATAEQLDPVISIPGGAPSYLRFAVRDRGGLRNASRVLGVIRPYPLAVAEQDEMRPALVPDGPATPGALELARSLYTLPTHRFVGRRDLMALEQWLQAATQGRASSAPTNGPGDRERRD